MNMKVCLIAATTVFCLMSALTVYQRSRVKPDEVWKVETCAGIQIVTHKSGDNSPETQQVRCINSSNPPYPEGISKTAPQAPSETYDAGKPDQGSQ